MLFGTSKPAEIADNYQWCYMSYSAQFEWENTMEHIKAKKHVTRNCCIIYKELFLQCDQRLKNKLKVEVDLLMPNIVMIPSPCWVLLDGSAMILAMLGT